jgi:hypothetical protein
MMISRWTSGNRILSGTTNKGESVQDGLSLLPFIRNNDGLDIGLERNCCQAKRWTNSILLLEPGDRKSITWENTGRPTQGAKAAKVQNWQKAHQHSTQRLQENTSNHDHGHLLERTNTSIR